MWIIYKKLFMLLTYLHRGGTVFLMKTFILAAAALSSGLGAFVTTSIADSSTDEKVQPKLWHMCSAFPVLCSLNCQLNENSYKAAMTMPKKNCFGYDCSTSFTCEYKTYWQSPCSTENYRGMGSTTYDLYCEN